MIEIRKATPEEIRDFYGSRVHGLVDIFGAFDGESCIGMCGVMRDPRYIGSLFEEKGRLVGFLDMRETPQSFGPRAVKAILSYLRNQGKTIYVQCEDYRFPKASRLLGILGFEPTEEIWADFRNPSQKLRLWKWQR